MGQHVLDQDFIGPFQAVAHCIHLPKINVDNGTSLFVDKDVLAVAISNSKNVTNNTTNCYGTSILHLGGMPSL
jgi:hypothetical protein